MQLFHSIDWPATLSAIATTATALIAFAGLRSWQKQIAYSTTHELAVRIAAAAGTLRVVFYSVRAPLVLAEEFPPEFHQDNSRPQGVISKRYQHVYTNRYAQLQPRIFALLETLGPAQVILGDPTASEIERLVLKAQKLHRVWSERVAQLERGEELNWPEENSVWRQEIVDSSHADRTGATDPLSVEFDRAYRALLEALRPQLPAQPVALTERIRKLVPSPRSASN
jgi:hypothetical protein